MSVLSIQSHVAYGHVGNSAAVFPLQSMGHEVWPVHTVQFSNHTGYGKWKGEVFSAALISDVVQGIEDIGQMGACEAILSGYMGSREICEAVAGIVQKFKAAHPDVVYLCDPVIGNTNCFVKPEVLDFFKEKLLADIITPNQFEAEILSGITISDRESMKKVAAFFHDRGISIVVITGIKLHEEGLFVFVSDRGVAHLVKTREFSFSMPVNGTGDLFSATFLGSYLRNREAPLAARHAVAFMLKVLQNTLEANSREMKVLSIHYDLAEVGALPEIASL